MSLGLLLGLAWLVFAVLQGLGWNWRGPNA